MKYIHMIEKKVEDLFDWINEGSIAATLVVFTVVMSSIIASTFLN